MGVVISGNRAIRDCRAPDNSCDCARRNSKEAAAQTGEDSGGITADLPTDQRAENVVDGMEKDTDDAEDATNLHQLLLPAPPVKTGQTPRPSLPTAMAKFSLSYNMEAFAGWVRQPSPCCAAASVAGAWNTVFGLDRTDPSALKHSDVLKVLQRMVGEQLKQKQASFDRLLGASIEPVLQQLSARLEFRGKPSEASGDNGTKRATKIDIIREITEQTIQAARRRGDSAVAEVGSEGETRAITSEMNKDVVCHAKNLAETEEIPDDLKAEAVYERLWELLRSETQADFDNLADNDFCDSCPDDDNIKPVSKTIGVVPYDTEYAENPTVVRTESPMDDTQSADNDEASSLHTKKNEVLEFDFGAPHGRRKQKGRGRGPPKALAKRLRGKTNKANANCNSDAEDITTSAASNQTKVAAAGSSCNTVNHGDLLVEDLTIAADGSQAEPCNEPNCVNERSNWNWSADLREVLRLRDGLAKLEHPTKPSTAIIGNWGILDAVKELEQERQAKNCGETPIEMGIVSAATIMGSRRGKKSAVGYVSLSHSDSARAKDDAWATLRSAFLTRGTALIFHLKNHYALIFALREWEEASPGDRGENDDCLDDTVGHHAEHDAQPAQLPPRIQTRHYVRQLLTARRGQRPSAWLDFDEAVRVMLSWEGYKIMRIELSTPSINT